MFSEDKYARFNHSCYDCYKEYYKHDRDSYKEDLDKFIKKQEKLNRRKYVEEE